MPSPRFASDNVAGAHPTVLEALVRCNDGPATAYGDDPWTRRAQQRIREVLGLPEAAVWPVFGGTGANILALRAVTHRVDSVVCASSSHIANAETGAPELVAGVALVLVPQVGGKLTPEAVRAALPQRDGDHRPRPRVLSVAQATERGTVYTPDELAALAEVAHAHDLLLHVDGARLPAAAAALGCSLAALVGEVGVDVLSFGGTKAGLVAAEAVVFADPARAPDAGRHRKQITQLASKQRFVSAQLLALLEDEAWRGWCLHAHDRAVRLAEGLAAVPGARLAAPVETNAVFVHLPAEVRARLAARWSFETYDPSAGLVRLMTAWDVTDAEVDALLADARREAAPPRSAE
ncbi:MAG: aminotransferase class V-fold PLP-dependent enzyme [Alphaproteobacteria bacterium]|nr:aminotransferase class V-fold PLP-dependent enzyme [Alphaproteobacteria bacterium]